MILIYRDVTQNTVVQNQKKNNYTKLLNLAKIKQFMRHKSRRNASKETYLIAQLKANKDYYLCIHFLYSSPVKLLHIFEIKMSILQ